MKTENEIIDAHMMALLRELQANGYAAVGVAGGVVFHDRDKCNAFYALMKGAKHPDGRPVDPAFMQADIGHVLMARLLDR